MARAFLPVLLPTAANAYPASTIPPRLLSKRRLNPSLRKRLAPRPANVSGIIGCIQKNITLVAHALPA